MKLHDDRYAFEADVRTYDEALAEIREHPWRAPRTAEGLGACLHVMVNNHGMSAAVAMDVIDTVMYAMSNENRRG